MKNLKTLIVLISLIGIVSCNNSSDVYTPPPALDEKAYLINYGLFMQTPSDISIYNSTKDSLYNGYFSGLNSAQISGNIQYMYSYGDRIYILVNDASEFMWVDKTTFIQTEKGISTLEAPRYCVANGDYLWISCWGPNVYSSPELSYLAKYNTKTSIVEKTIPLPNGPEGLSIKNGKLFIALSYAKQIAVMDLNNETFSYIGIPAVASYFADDKGSDNLYVTLTSTYSDPSDSTGLGYINTQINTLDNYYQLSGISSNYSQVIDENKDRSKIYLIAGSYSNEYVYEGGIQEFDTSTKTFKTFATGLVGVNGVAVDPNNSRVYCFISENPVAAGKMVIYDKDGLILGDHATGIYPSRMMFE